ncbi:MAG: Rid family hydrolase [Sterolibacterium sp.]|jgi:reactive intermediate/imine deaminase
MPTALAPSDPVTFLNSPDYEALGLPFSEMVRVGDLLFLSGQMGNLPGTLTLAPGGIEAEARQALLNIQTSLEAHGYSMAHIVKCTVMLADMADWAAFNAVYVSFFERPYPARSCFAARGIAMGGRLELDVIAVVRR